MELAERTCVPCRGGTPPLTAHQIEPLAAEVPEWTVVEDQQLKREFRFPDFRQALDFVVAIGEEAEGQDHHPDLELGWGRVGVRLSTHAIDGLSEADFIMAARIDRIHRRHAGQPAR